MLVDLVGGAGVELPGLVDDGVLLGVDGAVVRGAGVTDHLGVVGDDPVLLLSGGVGRSRQPAAEAAVEHPGHGRLDGGNAGQVGLRHGGGR